MTTIALGASPGFALAIDSFGDLLQAESGAANYSNLLSAWAQTKPKFVGWVQTLCEPFATNQTLLASFPAAFDLNTAVGQQLDFTGQQIGRTRNVEVPITTYFSWDTSGQGWDQAPWYSPFSPSSNNVALSDSDYRTVLAGGILNNYWNGSIPQAYAIWDSVFPPGAGPAVFLQDLGNMEMIIGLTDPLGTISAITSALFSSGKIVTKPVGVRAHYATIPSTPGKVFAWDMETTLFGGWDEGQWASITP